MERHKFRKETIVLLIMLIVTSISRAQSVDDTQQWNVLFTHVSTERQFTVIFSSSNDSIMYEGVRYKVLMAEEYDYCFNYGLLREEAGKLFFRKHDNPPMFEDEVLIYDWTLSEGDTVFVQRGNEANGLVLSLICDTIVNGSQKREYILSYMINPDIKEKWIEGMGSELGFPFSGTKIQQESYLGITPKSDLLCYHEGGELVWQNPCYDTCLLNFVSVQDNSMKSDVIVYPNPVIDDIYLQYGEESLDGFHYQIYNYQGECCASGIIKETNHISVTHLPIGIYILRISSTSLTKDRFFRFVKG